MIKTLFLRLCLLSFLLFGCFSVNGQLKSDICIQLPKPLTSDTINIFYNNGLKEKEIKNPQHFNNILISDSFYSIYATVIIIEKNAKKNFSSYKKFYVSDKPASIIYSNDKFGTVKLKNAYDVSQISYQFQNFIKDIQQKFDDYGETHQSLGFEYFELYKKLIQKKMLFIQQNRKFYFSFQVFKNEIVPITFPMTDGLIDSLYYFYSTTFSNELKATMEGKIIEKKLISKLIATHDNIKAPDFALTDISGNIISLQNCKGKFILLDFWASWCVPCVEELPAIKKIFESYSPKELVIISISYDKDSSQFLQAIDKYGMKWINIYRDETIAQDYGGRVFLPKLFLIDPDGIIIYNKDSNRQSETNELELLNKKLKEKLISKT